MDKMNNYKRQFREFIEREKIKLYDNLSDVIETDIQLSVGDRIMFTNDYGVKFGPFEVLGFCEPHKYGDCIYFEQEAYWSPCRVSQITKLDTENKIPCNKQRKKTLNKKQL